MAGATRVSILAGFVEAGESAEQAVAREVHEETGIAVGAVSYLGSQPWPMPQSLMLGFRAEAAGSTEIRVDADEIAEAHWYSRDDLRAAVESGDLLLPPPVSIAHRIIESWYGSALPGGTGAKAGALRPYSAGARTLYPCTHDIRVSPRRSVGRLMAGRIPADAVDAPSRFGRSP